MSYDNPIVGFQHGIVGAYHGFNYILQDGTRSALPLNYQPAVQYCDVKITKDKQVRRVVMNAGGKEGMINGVEFYDGNNAKLLTAGMITGGAHTKEFTLSEGERIVGVKSNQAEFPGSSNSPRQYEFQLIIGYMEPVE